MIGIDVMYPNEYEQVENLAQYKVLSPNSEPIFDQLAATAASILSVPMAVINFVSSNKVWNLVEQTASIDVEQDLGRNICSLVVQNDHAEKFESLTKDLGLFLNPSMLAELGLRFFASACITTNDGLIVGMVCVADNQSKDFSASDQRKLDWIASAVKTEMTKRITVNAVA